MTKKFLTLFTVAIFALSFTSCREQTAGEKAGDAIEDVADDIEDSVD